MRFHSIEYFEDSEGIYDLESFNDSIFREIPTIMNCQWNDLRFTFEQFGSDPDSLHEKFYLLESQSEIVNVVNEEVTIYELDEVRFALIIRAEGLAICIRDRDIDFIENID